MPKRFLFTLLALALGFGPAVAEASTVPRVDMAQGNLAVSGGYFDLSADIGILPGWTLGASIMSLQAIGMGPGAVPAVRTTWRLLGEPEKMAVGMILSAGLGTVPMYGSANFTGAFIQPGIVVSTPLAATPLFFRATFGPFLFHRLVEYADRTDLESMVVLLPWPNLELAWRVSPHVELTAGGNSIAGARMTF